MSKEVKDVNDNPSMGVPGIEREDDDGDGSEGDVTVCAHYKGAITDMVHDSVLLYTGGEDDNIDVLKRQGYISSESAPTCGKSTVEGGGGYAGAKKCWYRIHSLPPSQYQTCGNENAYQAQNVATKGQKQRDFTQVLMSIEDKDKLTPSQLQCTLFIRTNYNEWAGTNYNEWAEHSTKKVISKSDEQPTAKEDVLMDDYWARDVPKFPAPAA
ncbi:hypothetical protein BDK51DRAFT_31265, partial [Blyttiomyces helicus]